MDHISYRILCFSIVVAFTINFFPRHPYYLPNFFPRHPYYLPNFFPRHPYYLPNFLCPGHFGKRRFNHCLVVFTDLIRTAVCVLRSLQEKVWTSGNQNGRPWNTFFFFLTHVDLYAYRKVKHWPGLFLRWHAVGPIGAQILSAVMSFTQIYWMCHN